MNKLKFRSQDLKAAEETYETLETLIEELKLHFTESHFGALEICAEEIIEVNKQLRQMQKEKRKEDHALLVNKSKRLANSGIKTEVVTRCAN